MRITGVGFFDYIHASAASPRTASNYIRYSTSGSQAARAGGNAALTLGPLAAPDPGPYDAVVPTPLSHSVADLQSRLQSALGPGYRVEHELGGGGMSRVFLAQERELERQVVVKVLPPEMAAGVNAERFRREIQLAASLQHPHIVPLLAAGHSDDLVYYTMPLIDGESLRAKLAREGELPIPETVRLLRDVADALAYAHAHGVVHRDIKPDNVLVANHHAVVTDFGVAKALSESTGKSSLTSAGVALGTPAYMAPEQAAADPHTDHRCDIYAVGVLGYEMLTGRPPFTGATPQHVLAAQVTEVPEPVTKRRAAVPTALVALVMRCLEKSSADRWQTAEELVHLLEAMATPSGGVTPTGARPAARPFRPAAALLLGSLAVLVAVAALAAFLLRSRVERPVTLGRQSRITDAPGLETDPVISPDGRLIAYVAGPYFQSHLYVRQLSGGPAIDLTPTLPGRHTRPRWSPDGSELLFVTNDGPTRLVSRVSALGGVPRPMVQLESDDPIASADWSPDGAQVAYDLGGNIYLTAPGGTPARLYEGADPHSLSWSPDGRLLAFVDGGTRVAHGATGFANTAPSAILVVPSGGGPADTIAPGKAVNLSPTWGPDSRHLFFISNREGAKDVYRATLAFRGRLAGPPERLSTGLNAHTLALSADGRMLTFSTLVREANVWMLPLRPGQTITDDAAVQVATGNQVIERLSLSPDGRWLVFDSDRRGNANIYRQRLDQPGAEPEQLTTDSADDFAPAMSPDGREIVFHSLRLGNRDLWLMSSDGTNQRPLTRTPRDEYAGTWSPDGRSISFYADSAGTMWMGIASRGADGQWGTRLLLPRTPNSAAWSPDGTRLAAVHDGAVVLVPLPAGEPAPIYRLPTILQTSRVPVWSADGRSVYYREREPDGRLTLLSIPVDGRPPVALVRQRDASRSGPRSDWTTDGRRFFFTISHYAGDISTVEVR